MTRQPIRPAILAATRQLADVGVHSPRTDAELLAAHLLGVERTRLGMVPMVEPSILAAYRTMVDQRAKRIPLQYIIGTAAIGSVEVEVGPGVFVPRPETELLLAWALGFLECNAGHPPIVLDLCTGSGALALAIAHARPDAVVHAVELDDRALDWTMRNAQLRADAGDTPVHVHHGDATDPTLLEVLDGRIDLVVANPPYIPVAAQLDPEVIDHDPHTALFAGDDGLDVIAPMIPNIARWLKSGGGTAIEHDDTNGTKTAALFTESALFGDSEEHMDLAGKPRFVVARRL